MNSHNVWLAALLTAAVVALYEARFALARRTRPWSLARTAHAELRQEWFDAVSQQPGSEILTVQTLRNALMTASLIASTSALGFMGAISLFASSISPLFQPEGATAILTPRLVVEIMILALLFGALATATLSVRYYHHAGFIGGMPVGTSARQRWQAVGRAHVRRAGNLYGWSVRNLILVIPPLAFILHPWAGPVLAVAVVLVLRVFDRMDEPLGEVVNP